MSRAQDQETLQEQLTEVWKLVDELGVLSQRLKEAADAALTAIERKDGGGD